MRFTMCDIEEDALNALDADLDQEDEQRAEDLYFFFKRLPVDIQPQEAIAKIKAFLQGDY